MTIESAGKIKRIHEYDGIRALAVIAVMISHEQHDVMPGGGKMGVGLFLVLSGYIITRMLVREQDKSGHISIKKFYMRRARRLLPALLAFCAAIWVWGFLFLDGSYLPRLNASILQALTFTTNFAQWLGWPNLQDNLFGHMWSLAVEEQFYLLWPPLLILGLRLGMTRNIALSLVLVCWFGRLLMWTEGVHYWHIGDLMQWDGLLLGAALALTPDAKLSKLWLLPAVIAAVGMCFIDRRVYFDWWTLDMCVQSLSCLVIIHFAPQWKWLSFKPLAYVGLISYSLYIIHYPITSQFSTAYAYILSVGLAMISYHCVEIPGSKGITRLFNLVGGIKAPE